MKVLHLSTFEQSGGAARATMRLHDGLLRDGVDSQALVMNKGSNRPEVHAMTGSLIQPFNVRIRPRIDALPLIRYPNMIDSPWNVGWLPSGLSSKIDALNPDVVHMHWVGAGFFSIEEMKKLPRKWVWTMHDAWAFTGGCHILGECVAFEGECSCCPQLSSQNKYDLSNEGWLRRRELFSKKIPVIIAPSKWISEKVRSSSLLRDSRIEIIPNGLDTSIYYPMDKSVARQNLGLAHDKQVILFGALSASSNKNKGYEKFKEALLVLTKKYSIDQIQLVVFGDNQMEKEYDFGFDIKFLGKLNSEESLVRAYSAADVLCVPSLQESFGQVASEGMACGVPVVAFATSGLLDIVDHLTTGYLAKPFDVVDFANGIEYILHDKSKAEALSKASRMRSLERFDIKNVVKSHQVLYKEL
jgi:glycosyltransferase involved in cell wall biosynthesis